MRDYFKFPFIPPFWLLAAVIVMVTLDKIPKQLLILNSPLNNIGWLLIVSGLGIALYVDLIFKRQGTTILPFRTATSLVTIGPFRYSRNPIYTGMVTALFGLALTLGKLLPILVLPVFIWTIQHCFIRHEEADLEETFGADYRNYKSRVRRWI